MSLFGNLPQSGQVSSPVVHKKKRSGVRQTYLINDCKTVVSIYSSTHPSMQHLGRHYRQHRIPPEVRSNNDSLPYGVLLADRRLEDTLEFLRRNFGSPGQMKKFHAQDNMMFRAVIEKIDPQTPEAKRSSDSFAPVNEPINFCINHQTLQAFVNALSLLPDDVRQNMEKQFETGGLVAQFHIDRSGGHFDTSVKFLREDTQAGVGTGNVVFCPLEKHNIDRNFDLHECHPSSKYDVISDGDLLGYIATVGKHFERTQDDNSLSQELEALMEKLTLKQETAYDSKTMASTSSASFA